MNLDKYRNVLNPAMIKRISAIPIVSDVVTMEFWDVSFNLGETSVENNDGEVIPAYHEIDFAPVFSQADGVVFVCAHGPPSFVRTSLHFLDFAYVLLDKFIRDMTSKTSSASSQKPIMRFLLIHKQDIVKAGVIIMRGGVRPYLNLFAPDILEQYAKLSEINGCRESTAELGGGARTVLCRSIKSFATTVMKEVVTRALNIPLMVRENNNKIDQQTLVDGKTTEEDESRHCEEEQQSAENPETEQIELMKLTSSLLW